MLELGVLGRFCCKTQKSTVTVLSRTFGGLWVHDPSTDTMAVAASCPVCVILFKLVVYVRWHV